MKRKNGKPEEPGFIDAAITEVERTHGHYVAEVKRCTREAERWAQVAEFLRKAKEITARAGKGGL